MPELMTPGEPVFYATTFMRRGRSHGVLVETIETTLGLTGAVADERLALAPADIERLVWRAWGRLAGNRKMGADTYAD